MHHVYVLHAYGLFTCVYYWYCTCLDKTCECKGLYDPVFKPVHDDGVSGATTAKKIWTDVKQKKAESPFSLAVDINLIKCSCCSDYRTWKEMHCDGAKQLQAIADKPYYYKVCDEKVTVNGIEYNKTIRALPGATKGECMKKASETGDHPFVCDACDSLRHGQTSQLLRRVQRSQNLKYQRGDQRVGKSGFNNKFASKSELEAGIRKKQLETKADKRKVSRLQEAQKKLHTSWKEDETIRPFMDKLATLLQNNSLSEFDLSFLSNWLGKKYNGKYYRADEQARSLAILLSNRLGEKLYSTIAPMMGLPLHRQAQRIKAKDIVGNTYMPGLNCWAFEMASMREVKPLQVSMDGTRVVRIIELYKDEFLVGESFSPDVRQYPSIEELPTISDWKSVQSYITSVRSNGTRLAAEAYTIDIVDLTGQYPDLLLGSIPEATRGVTASHIYSLMMTVEEKAAKVNLSITGHCTDSASNALGALEKLAMPSALLTSFGIKYIGLSMHGFNYVAPILREGYPSIAYPCWDHSARTAVRNLMNSNISIIAEGFTIASGINTAKVASVHDLKLLKQNFSGAYIRHGDISPLIQQNCDAAGRILSQKSVDELAAHVPGSSATQLYLQAEVWIHAPYRDNAFGTPLEKTRCLWAGLMVFRRWRQYIILSPGLKLSSHFISRLHYLTLELLVHAAINHFLCLFLCFPDIPMTQYSLRNTGNRSLEALHGTFRGGTSSLPITSPNLSFREFLERMNKMLQIHKAEHMLQQIEGHSIVASKKKRKTYAKYANTDALNLDTPIGSYSEFSQLLQKACTEGDTDSQKLIMKHAPKMASLLKSKHKWESSDIISESITDSINLVKERSDMINLHIDVSIFQKIIVMELGQKDISLAPIPSVTDDVDTDVTATDDVDTDANQCLANLLVDASPITPVTAIHKSSYLRAMQPQREVPSKDRGRRFAAGTLEGNQTLLSADESNSIREFDYWILFPSSSRSFYKKAKVFVLGQIILILVEGKPLRSCHLSPGTQVVLRMYCYNSDKRSYTPDGMSSLLNADLLEKNVTDMIVAADASAEEFDSEQGNTGSVVLTVEGELADYRPFYKDMVIDLPESMHTCDGSEGNGDEEYIVEEVVKKRYNSKEGHYEYRVKWKGYSAVYNTWELESNIPSNLLDEFEKKQMHMIGGASNASTPQREGLRDRSRRKTTFNSNYRFN